MTGKRTAPVATVIILVLVASTSCQGQSLPLSSSFPAIDQSIWSGPPNDGYFFYLGFRKYFSSFTSYQFPEPDHRQLNPVSRLEWPWEQICGVVKATCNTSTFELRLEYSSTALTWSGLKAQDSDWENPTSPGQKTTFSQGKAMPRIWAFDASLALVIPQATWMKAIGGFRGQQFRFTDTDAIQGTIARFDADDNFIGYLPVAEYMSLPGAGIEFSQYYKHYFLGGVASGTLNVGNWYQGPIAPSLNLLFQADVALVTGKNHDQHLLRTDESGNGVQRDTYEDTRGWAWHLNLIAGLRINSFVGLELEGDLKRITTTGDHDLRESSPLTNISRSWNGAKVWSQQAYIGINGSVRF